MRLQFGCPINGRTGKPFLRLVADLGARRRSEPERVASMCRGVGGIHESPSAICRENLSGYELRPVRG